MCTRRYLKDKAAILLHLRLPEGDIAAYVPCYLIQGLVAGEHGHDMVSGPQHGMKGHADELLGCCYDHIFRADRIVQLADLLPQGQGTLRVCVSQAQLVPPASQCTS